MTASRDTVAALPNVAHGGSTWAFSTLGCPGDPLADVLALALRHEIGGLEVRITPTGFLRPTSTPLDIARIRVSCAEAGIDILSVTSRLNIAAVNLGTDELRSQLAIAETIGAGGLRVFMGGEDEAIAVDRIRAAADAGGRVLIETHDSHSTGAGMAAFFTRLERAGVAHACGIVWDTAHSWSAGESLASTLAVIEPWVAYVQVKDVLSRHDPAPVMPGAGAFPIAELADALTGRRATLSLEWERRWHPNLPPLDTALTALSVWAAPLTAANARPAAPQSSR